MLTKPSWCPGLLNTARHAISSSTITAEQRRELLRSDQGTIMRAYASAAAESGAAVKEDDFLTKAEMQTSRTTIAAAFNAELDMA
eukprot:2771917-Pyramimonas_sp.AAC.1